MLAQGFSILTFYFLLISRDSLLYGPVDKAIDTLFLSLRMSLEDSSLLLSHSNLNSRKS